MTPAQTQAVRLAAAVEAFADGTGLVLARELRAFLESGAVPVGSADAAGSSVVAELQAEVARLREELARAKDAARKRTARRAAVPAPAVDPRQVNLFTLPAERPADVRTDVPDALSPRDPDPVPDSNQDRKRARGRTGAGRVDHDPQHPPPWLFEDAELPAVHAARSARGLEPRLSEHVLREMWGRFATKKPSHRSLADARQHARRWLEREDPELRRSTATSGPVEEPDTAREPCADGAPEPLKTPSIARIHPKNPDRSTEKPLDAVALHARGVAAVRFRLDDLPLEEHKAVARALLRELDEPRSLSA